MGRFRGIFTPIVTPFRSDDTLDEGALRRNIDRWMRSSLRGLVVLGSNGEAAQLDDEESDRVIDVAREQVPADRVLIAGTGRESTRATIAATQRAASAGADAALVRTPSFFKAQMNSDAFVRHYTQVADASPIPVLLYNVTMFTGVNLQPDAVERLAAHPNIVGMKESGSDVAAISDVIARTPSGFDVLAGSATTLFYAFCAGCSGAVLAIASLVPEDCVLLQKLVSEGHLDEARLVQQRLLRVARAIGPHGVAGLKAALQAAGYDAGIPRPPLHPLTADVAAQMRLQLDLVTAS